MIGGPAPTTLPVSPDRGCSRYRAGPGRPGGRRCRSGTWLAPLVPLLNQLGVPANLANLTPADLPVQIGDALGITPAPAAAPVTGPPTGPLTTPPVSTVPLLPDRARWRRRRPLPLLNALP